MKKIKVAIVGTGNIGTDLLIKTLRSKYLECSLFSGRSFLSPGLNKFKKHKKKNIKKYRKLILSDKGANALVKNAENFDLIFDCTSAKFHKKNFKLFRKLNKKIINLTPTNDGYMCIPILNLVECDKSIELNMISCGAQSSVPVAFVMSKIFKKRIQYIETASTISSKSAGPSTRLNLDEYIYSTQRAINYFAGVKKCKAILNLNPAVPCINMETTTYAKIRGKVSKMELNKFKKLLKFFIMKLRKYIKGHKIIVEPSLIDDVLVVKTITIGAGDYLPSYAGNLDIINCAAVAAGEYYAKKYKKKNNH